MADSHSPGNPCTQGAGYKIKLWPFSKGCKHEQSVLFDQTATK